MRPQDPLFNINVNHLIYDRLIIPGQSHLDIIAMRLLPNLVIALAAVPAALAVDQKKSAIVWFDDPSTPDSIVNQARESIIKAGGKITHVYSIIK